MKISPERIAEIQAMPDDAIDTSDIPEATEAFFRRARLVRRDSRSGLRPDHRDGFRHRKP